MRSVRIAVVGCGRWGLAHARTLKEVEGAELVAVSDVDPGRARAAGARYGVEWLTDNEELFKKPGLDAVTICTPPSTHAEVALSAIKHGLDLLVEKPLATTSEDALRVARAAEEEGVGLMVGHIERFNPAVRAAKSALEGGRVGRPVALHSRRTSEPPSYSDVGVVLDLAVHDIDVVRYLLGEEPSEVYAVASRLRRAHEDYACLILKSPSAAVLVEASWTSPRKERSLAVYCSGGAIYLDYASQRLTIEDPSGSFTPSLRQEELLKAELQSFVSSLLSGVRPEVDGVDGYRAVCVAEAALRSASLGAPVRVSYSL